MNSTPLLVKSAPPFALTSTVTSSASLKTGARHVTRLEVIIRTPSPVTTWAPNLHCSPLALEMPPLNITDTAVPRPKVPVLGRTPVMRNSSRYSNFKLPIKKAPKEPSDTRSSTVLRLLDFGDTQTTPESPRTSPATTAVPKWHETVPASPCILPYIDTVTVVPPPTEAILGVTDEIPRPPSNVSCMLDSPVSTPLLLTLTRTVPAPLVGAMHFTMDDEAYTALAVVLTPILQLNPSVCSKCRPTTVITWFAAPATANEGRRLSTVALGW